MYAIQPDTDQRKDHPAARRAVARIEQEGECGCPFGVRCAHRRSLSARRGWETRRAWGATTPEQRGWGHLRALCTRTDPVAARLYACDVAAELLPLYEEAFPGDYRPRVAIDTARRYAAGTAGDRERLGASQLAMAACRLADAAPAVAHWDVPAYVAAECAGWPLYRTATKGLITTLDWAGHLHRGERAIAFYARHIAALEALRGSTPAE